MHIWVIMDWNRRWAKQKGLPAFFWHKAWADNVKKITEIAWREWIEYLTLWALSKENLIKRDKEEVEKIISLINNIENFLWEMMTKWLVFRTIWDIEKLPEKSVNILRKLEEKTKNNKWINLTVAFIYSWQDEIIRTTKKIINSWVNPEDLTNEEFRKYLDTSFLPNPDLIIRTWWDIRHSWFLLFDSEYSEYYFTDKKWPEFDENEFLKALGSLSSAKRNFGK
jgi:undecaprenyl diphosphate synthase